MVGEHGVLLSGGQKQRISMARLFLKNPPILIFDEATSSLDAESEVFIQESLERLCVGRSTLVIAHRLSTVKKADYTYVMRNGKVVESGNHNELIEKRGYYFDLYNRNII
jgi:ATP-binding cassette subfamily B protein